ncbi:MAG: hypothetical protein Q8916_10725 [Bacteroidota bacterium]|nr:hypothetical protein [Bacteroidota bacterium]MDP4230863.1 hypothetical protein [Bacteroidota bacterium]MDP4236315.1 hypothetical protein [Bacteroidota bacterium]
MRRTLLLTFLAFFFSSCSKKEGQTLQYSCFDLRMDGSWMVPDVGVPSTCSTFAYGDSTKASLSVLTAPTPLANAGEYTYAISATNFTTSSSLVILGNETSSKIIASIPGAKPIIELLTDPQAIYAVHLDGKVDAMDHGGKNLWSAHLSGFSTAHSILTGEALIGATDSAITSIDIRSGKIIWSYPTSIGTARSLIYDDRTKCCIALLSAYNRGVPDTIITFASKGEVRARLGFPGMRIISNLCLCGKDRNKIALGYLKEAGSGLSERTMHVAIYSGIEDSVSRNLSDHTISYFATKICSNGPVVLSAGFYSGSGDLESGIDAFYADDTLKLWQRRFTYPVVTPVGISTKYAYFALTFSTESVVPSRSIFYTLDLSTGKTLGELPVGGKAEGMVNAIPMPMNERGFMMADPLRPVIYFLKP